MSEISRDVNTSHDSSIGPDLFQYYIRGVSELLSGDEFSPSSSRLIGTTANRSVMKKDDIPVGSVFSNAVGDGLSPVEKAKLMSVLRQSVVTLTREVDEMLGPVLKMNRLRALMAPTKTCARLQDANSDFEIENRQPKRLKGSQNEEKSRIIPDKMPTRCENRGCAKFSELDNNTQKNNPNKSKSLCGDCLKQANGSGSGSFLGSSSKDDKGNGEVNDDLQVLLVNRGPKVIQVMEKHSAELSATLGRMEEKLEKLLDVIISSCRPMTLVEKHKLRNLIEKLPPKNLDRVAEIIQKGKPSKTLSTHTLDVEFQNEDDLTLWRLYFYVKAVENAQKLL